MTEFISDAVIFLIALVAIIYVRPYCNKFFNGKYFNHFVSQKLLDDLSDEKSGVADNLIDTHDDIGLSNKKKTLLDHKAVKEFIQSNKEKVDHIKGLLIKSGKREDEDFMKFIVSGICIYIACASVLVFYLLTRYVTGVPVSVIIAISIPVGIYIGYLVAVSNLAGQVQERQEKIDSGVPDLIDLFVICSDSGLDLNRSLARIAREIRNSNVELSDELTITAIEIEMIPDYKQVFNNMENRTDSQQIKALAKTLSQSIEYGSPLSELLKSLSIEARQRKILLAEEKAARIPTLITLPLMLFILPCLFIVMLGPVVIEVMQNF